jgi:hypothetical protein
MCVEAERQRDRADEIERKTQPRARAGRFTTGRTAQAGGRKNSTASDE